METFEINGTRYRVREKELQQHQTEDSPRIAQIRREFAEHPSSGLTPAKLAVIMTNAEQGDLIQQCYLAEDIEEKDGHIQAELFKRKMALSDIEFNVVPPANATPQESKDAAEIEETLKNIDGWHDVIFGMADGILKGFSNTEFEWEMYQSKRVPTNFQHRPATWFQLNQNNQNEIMLRDQSGKGEALRPLNWLQHRHSAKSGYPARIGLIRQLAWPFIFKNYSLRDLAEFLEIYGIPVRLGKYPSGATDTEKQRLLQAVLSIGHNAGGVIPKGMEIEFHDAAKGGGSDPFMTMMSHCERIQSKVIVGQTLTSQVDSTGSQALGNVHDGIRVDIRDHDLREIAMTLNRDLVWPMHVLNSKSYTGDKRRRPRLVFDTQEPEDLGLYADALPKLVGIGVQVPVQYAHDKLRIPRPEGNEPILTTQLTQALQPKGKGEDHQQAALKSAIAALKARSPEPTDAPEHFTSKLKNEIGDSFAGMFEPIQALVEGADSLESLKEKLLELESQLDTQAFQEQLGQAFVAAELAGRYDVNEGE